MKKQMKKLCKWSALALCLSMLVGNMQILASSEGTFTDASDITIEPVSEDRLTDEPILEESDHVSHIDEPILEETSTEKNVEHNDASEEIIVEGLEGIQLDKIEYMGRSTGSCQGFLHNWQVTQTIQEQTCGKQGIWRIKCADCGVTATTFSDIYDHDYDGGICKNCGGIEVAPEGELGKWLYSLNNNNMTIETYRYRGTPTDIIVYGKYEVNGVLYSTILNGDTSGYMGPFHEKRDSITSIKIHPGVKSNKGFQLFYDCSALTSLDVSGLDTSSITDMSGMFEGCSSLTSLDLSSFDTSKVYQMSCMFQGCSSLTSLDLSSFNTSGAGPMNFMFAECSNLTSLDLSSFDTPRLNDTTGMFQGCSSLTSLDLSSFNTSRVSGMGSMFKGCSSLTSLDLSSFDTSIVRVMHSMFKGCSNLASLDLSSFNTSTCWGMGSMFEGCSSLTSLDLSSFMTNNVDTMDKMFQNCPNLSTIYVSRSWNPTWADTTDMFTDCGASNVTLKK